MSSIPQITANGNNVSDFATRFMKRFHLGRLLFKCNAGKEKGIPVMDIFRYLFCMMFSDRSIYMQMKTGTFEGNFSKNTIYRFMNNARTNWQRFTALLSASIICSFMKPLTDEKRKDVFIVDDSLFDRSRSKKVELLARVFDHCSMKYRSGFRMLTLGWSDGNSFVPVSYSLLSASADRNLIWNGKDYDARSLAGRRRRQSRRKATDVMVELIHSAQCAGITARYVLFDSWFSAPKTIITLKMQEHLDTIAMMKKSKAKYSYQGEKLNVKEIYSRNKKRRGCSRYLLSVSVDIEKDGATIPAKLVYVRNKSKRKDWLVLVSTDTQLSEEEIIRIYGKRWDIEVFFKACKSYLNLVKEYRGISYDAMNAHVAIVFSRYMMLSVAQRENEDDRTICELCFCLLDEMEDITFSRSMYIIIEALSEAIMEYFHITEAQLEEFTSSFVHRLPQYMQEALGRRESAS